jgi:hypothetical protein
VAKFAQEDLAACAKDPHGIPRMHAAITIDRMIDFSAIPVASAQLDQVIRSGLTDTEILGYLFRFPCQRIAAFRSDLFEMQPHSLARLNARRVAREGVNPFVLFVGHGHAVLSSVDASGDGSLLVGIVDDHNDYDYDCRDRDDRERKSCIRGLLQLIRCRRGGERYTKNANQRHAPKVS